MHKRLANFFASLKPSARSSLIREEIVDDSRLQTAKLSKESLSELTTAEPIQERELRIVGDNSYRILHHELAEEFNFFRHEKNSRQTDLVISEYQRPEFKHYSLDLVIL